MPIIKSNLGYSMTIKGRGGLEFINEIGIGYYIDGEMVDSDNYDYAIYSDSIEMLDGRYATISDIEKASILEKVKELCEKGNIRAKFFHDQS